MKKNVLGLLVASALSWSAVAGSVEGGMNGGGGGTIVANPATPGQIKTAAREARLTLMMLFTTWEGMQSYPYGTMLKDFPRARDVVSNTKIEFDDMAPCLGADGLDHDAYAPGTTSDSICLSVFSLQKKLSQENYQAQTVALVAHEFSHLLGLDEEQATFLQGQVYFQLLGESPKAAGSLLSKVMESSIRMSVLFSEFKTMQKTLTARQSFDALVRMRDFLNATSYSASTEFPLSVFDSQQTRWNDGLSAKFSLLLWHFGSQIEGERRDAEENINMAFESDTQITLPQYEDRVLMVVAPRANPQGFVLRKIVDETTLNLELNDVSQLLKEQLAYIGKLVSLR